MLKGIDRKKIISTLDKSKLPEYFGQYFVYEKDSHLHELTKEAFLCVIGKARKMDKPYIDSQIEINKLLTDLSKKHNFQRQFSERFPNLVREQVLGMQLYKLIVEDSDLWIFCPVQKEGHLHEHASYFKEK